MDDCLHQQKKMIKHAHRGTPTPPPSAPAHLNHHHQHQHHLHLNHSDLLQSQGRETGLINRVRFKLFMSEFLGTFMFVYLGQAGLASFELIGTQNDIINRQAAIIVTYGLAFMLATLTTLSLSGAHLNPAYTLASALFGRLAWGRAINYMGGQYLGSFVAAIFLHATYSDKLSQRHLEGLLVGMNSTLRAHGNILSTGKLFSSYPPTEVSLTQLTISYTLATAHLMFLLVAIHESKLVRIPRSLRPVYLASSLCLVLAAFAANGGPVLNPAHDFSPRLYISIFGWGSAAFNLYHYKYWWLCGLLAPHLGALIGFTLHQLLNHLNNIRELSHSSNLCAANGLDGDDDHDHDHDRDNQHHLDRHHNHRQHHDYNALTRDNEHFK